MTVDIEEDFEGGSDGGAVTEANTDLSTINGSPTFDDAHVARGALAMRCAASSSVVSGGRTYTTRAVTYTRAYIYLESLPGANFFILGVQSSATIRAQVRIDGTGHTLTMRNGTTAIWTSSTVLSTDTLYRVEWLVDNTNSLQRLRLYAGHSSSPIEDSGDDTYNQGTHDRSNVGVVSSGTGTIWVDDFASGDEGWFGPSQTGTDATAQPAAVAQSVSAPAPTMHIGSTVTASAVTRAAAIPTASVSGGTAADIAETFEGGSGGATITTGNTGFSVVSGSPTFTSSAIVGSLAMRCSTSSSSQYGSIQYASRDVTYVRWYFRTPSSAPAAITYLANVQSGATIRAQMRLNVAMSVSLRNATTAVWTSGPTLDANTVYRAEWRVDNVNSQQQLRVFVLHSTTALIDSGNQTYDQGLHDRTLVGVVASATLTYEVDDVEVRSDTWAGPSVVGSDATPTPSSVTQAAAVPAPSLSTGVTVAASAVARSAVAPAPAMSTSSTLAAVAVSRAAVADAPTVTTGAAVAASAVSRAVTVPEPVTQTTQGGTAAPAAVSRAVAIPAFAAQVDVMVDPPSVAQSAAIAAPTVVTDATSAATSVSVAVTVPTPAHAASQVLTPAAVSRAVTIPAATASAVQRLSSPASLAAWQATWDAVPHPAPGGSGGTGWVGGGGGWSVTHPSSESALFLFGDSPVIAEGGGHNFPRNTAILWTEADGLRLVGAPFVPADGDGTWYGAGPTAVIGGDLYIFAPKRSVDGDEGTTIFRYTWPTSIEAPVYAEKLDTLPTDITWGAAVVEFGGYVYVFGSYRDPGANSSRLYLARTTDVAASPTGWEYLTPSGWDNSGSHLISTAGLQVLVSDTPGVEQILSVHAHAGGLRMVSKAGGGVGSDVTIWDASDPTGPWLPRVVAQAPLGTPTASDITFSAVGHFNLPALPSGQALVSVSRNRFGVDLEDFFPDPTFYRPLWFAADGSVTRVFPAETELGVGIPEPTPTVSRTATPAAVARAAVVTTPTLSTDSTPSPAPVTVAATVPVPVAQTSVTVAAQETSRQVAVPTPGVGDGTSATAESVPAAVAVPTPLVDSQVTPAPTVVLVPVAVPIPDGSATSTLAANAVGRSVVVPSPTVETSSSQSVAPDEVSRAVTVPEVTPVTSAVVQVVSAVLVGSVAGADITAGVSASSSPSVVTVVAELPSTVITAGSSATVATVAAVATVASPDLGTSSKASATAVACLASVLEAKAVGPPRLRGFIFSGGR